MASSLKNTLISSLRPLNDILLGRNNNNNNSNPVVLNTSIGLFLLLGAATTATTYYLAYPSYAAWLALEPGAIPHNFLGYLMNLGMRAVVARSDTRAVPPPYATRDLRPVYGDAGERSFFSPLLPSSKEEEKEGSGLGLLERRKEPRPEVPAAVAPHRQTSEKASPEVVGRMNGFLEERVKRANEEEEGGIFAWKDSRLEGPTNKAIWIAEQKQNLLPPFLNLVRGEIAHVHGEGSSHLTLSPADAATAVERGWAERHRLSGVGGARGLSWGYVLVYAPRDEAELAVWKELVMASLRFVAASLVGVGVVEGDDVK